MRKGFARERTTRTPGDEEKGTNIFLIDFRTRDRLRGKLSAEKKHTHTYRGRREKNHSHRWARVGERERESLAGKPIEVRLKYKMVLRIRRFYVPFQLLSHSTAARERVFFLHRALARHYLSRARALSRERETERGFPLFFCISFHLSIAKSAISFYCVRTSARRRAVVAPLLSLCRFCPNKIYT